MRNGELVAYRIDHRADIGRNSSCGFIGAGVGGIEANALDVLADGMAAQRRRDRASTQ
jgi:hypothetical protein